MEKHKRALRLFKQGYSIQQVATEIAVHRSTAKRWHEAFIANGAILPKIKNGRPSLREVLRR